MEKAVLLAVVASICTATSSVCQRVGAKSTGTEGFDIWLVFRLARRPIWLLGIASMIAGFAFQITALHFGELALVQPILALELLFVFGYMALPGSRRVNGVSRVKMRLRDWLAAAAMSAGVGLFLAFASPSGGRLHAPRSSWLVAGVITLGLVLLVLAVAYGPGNRPGVGPGNRPGVGPGNRPGASRSRRAALLGAATGMSWGFVAAIIKELSSHLGDGLGAIFTSWSLYALLAVGAATMLLASHALAAGPLAASQPGFTVLDPLTATLLGVFLFGEHLRTGVPDLAAEALALALVFAGASALSHSCLVLGEDGDPSCLPASFRPQSSGERLPAGRSG